MRQSNPSMLTIVLLDSSWEILVDYQVPLRAANFRRVDACHAESRFGFLLGAESLRQPSHTAGDLRQESESSSEELNAPRLNGAEVPYEASRSKPW